MEVKRIYLLLVFTFGFFKSYSAAQSQYKPVEKYHTYYPNGTIKERGYYLDGQKHRTWIYYTPNGNFERKEKYKKGKLMWQIFYNNKGKVIKTIDKNGLVKTRPNCGC